MNTRLSLYLFFGLLLAGFLLPNPGFTQEELVPVSVARVQLMDVYDEIPLSGTVSAIQSAHLSSRVEGFIVNLLVAEGDEIEIGDTILELDPTMASIEVTRVRAQLQESRIRYTEAIRQRDEIIKLLAKNAVSDSEVARADSEVSLYAAGVERLTAEHNRELELLSRHTVIAPFSGVISGKFVELGGWVETSTPLIELVVINLLRVEVPVPQVHFASVTVGTPVDIGFDALATYTFRGVVTTRIPVSTNNARTFPVYIEIDNSQRLIAPGMSAKVKLEINHTADALMLPKDAIVRDAQGAESVWVVTETDGVTEGTNRIVRSGRNFGGWVEVNGNLQVGDRVVVHGNESLRTDQRLHITEEIQPAS